VHKLRKGPFSASSIYSCILTFSFCLKLCILAKFSNHGFSINFGETVDKIMRYLLS